MVLLFRVVQDPPRRASYFSLFFQVKPSARLPPSFLAQRGIPPLTVWCQGLGDSTAGENAFLEIFSHNLQRRRGVIFQPNVLLTIGFGQHQVGGNG